MVESADQGAHFNSQPREGGWAHAHTGARARRDFNSQPREGGWEGCTQHPAIDKRISTHSRAKAAGYLFLVDGDAVFQLTAARRRLVPKRLSPEAFSHISTHSRAKAAGSNSKRTNSRLMHFNSQPREGGWLNFLASKPSM